jgi:integrase
VLPTLGSSTRAQDVTPAHLRAMVDKLTAAGQSGSSVRGAIVATSALFRHAVRHGVVATNPVRLLERGDRPSGKRRTEPRYLDRAAIDKLLAELGNEMRPVAAVMAFAGLRVSEALALRWRDVNLDDGMLDVPGTKTEASSQPAPLTADLVAERRAHRRRAGAKSLPNVRAEALVFSHDRRKVSRAVYAAGDRAKLNPDGAPARLVSRPSAFVRRPAVLGGRVGAEGRRDSAALRRPGDALDVRGARRDRPREPPRRPRDRVPGLRVAMSCTTRNGAVRPPSAQ